MFDQHDIALKIPILYTYYVHLYITLKVSEMVDLVKDLLVAQYSVWTSSSFPLLSRIGVEVGIHLLI